MSTWKRLTGDPVNTMTAGVVFLLTLVVYTITMTPTVPFWDSGEFIATSYILGVPHAPGTPLYVLLGRIFTMLPLGNVAQRVNWFSALSSALAVLFIYLVTVKVIVKTLPPARLGGRRVLAYVGGAVAAFVCAFATTFWDNAVEAEVYAASCALMAFVVWLVLRWEERLDEGSEDGLLLLITYIVGLGIGIHLGVAIAAWAAVIYVFSLRPSYLTRADYLGWGLVTLSLATGIHAPAFAVAPVVLILCLAAWMLSGRLYKLATWASVLFMTGVSVHFFLIIRSNLDPIINEAAPKDWIALWKMLIRDQYKPPPITERKAEFGYQFDVMYLRYLWWNFHTLGHMATDIYRPLDRLRGFLQPTVLLTLLGAIVHVARERRTAVLMGVLYFLLGPAMVIYLNFKVGEVRERDYFFVQNFMFMAVWTGLGTAFAVDWFRRQVAAPPTQRIILVTGALALVVVSLVPMVRNWAEHDRRGFFVAHDYAYNMLEGLDHDALIFTNGDNDTFPLWYIQEVEKVRKDVRVVNLSLLNTDWYIKQLRDLEPKVPMKWTDDQVARLLPYRDRNGRVWMVKDQAVQHILEVNAWRRPAYIAVTVPDQMGLEKQLVMEGLAFRIHPTPQEQSLNVDLTYHNLNEVYHYKGLVLADWSAPDSTVYKDENSSRLVQNYAAAFSRLSLELFDQGKKDEALEQMRRARLVSPTFAGAAIAEGVLLEQSGRKDDARRHYEKMIKVHPTEWQLPFRLANLLANSEQLEAAVPYYQKAIALAPPNQFYPYQGLTSALYQLNRYEEAIENLEGWLRRNPDDRQGVRPIIDEIRHSMQKGPGAGPADSVSGKPAGKTAASP